MPEVTRPSCMELFSAQWSREEPALVCCGLDIDLSKIPNPIGKEASYGVKEDAYFKFCCGIVDANHDLVGCYKINLGFALALGPAGLAAAARTVYYIKNKAPQVPIIGDIKAGDIGNSSEAYAAFIFDCMGFDAITVNPYVGWDGIEPFLRRKDKVSFVLCRTSNDSAKELQDLGGTPLFMEVARMANFKWNVNGNCGLVAGATDPDTIRHIRLAAPTLPILIPGVGAQQGDLGKAVVNGKFAAEKGGCFVNASRSLTYVPDPRAAAQAMHDEIVSYL